MSIFSKNNKSSAGISEKARRGQAAIIGTGRECRDIKRCDTGDNPELNTLTGRDGGRTAEKIYSNAHNASIVLGRDRPGSVSSGYGGQGYTHCASIDIVVGRMGADAKTGITDDRGKYSKLLVDPNFTADAARIYISQKTDVDDNFRLPDGSMPRSEGRSAIAMKADGIRIIAREGIKIISGASQINSQNGKVNPKAHGIDLIANSQLEGELQPIPKGRNLQSALIEICDNLDNLAEIMFNFVMSQAIFNLSVMFHTHNSPFFGIPVVPSVTLQTAGSSCITELMTKVATPTMPQKVNNVSTQVRYLTPGGVDYINSYYNNTN